MARLLVEDPLKDSGSMTMNEPHPSQAVLDDLLARLRLSVVAADQAYGEVQGSPVTMTVLGVDPLALLLGFKIQSAHPSHIDLPGEIESLVNQKKADVSLENGIAWFSLDDLSEETSESIEGLITSFCRGLAEANVRLPEGCVQCRSSDDLELVYSDGRCSRLCGNCRERIVDEHVDQEAELTRPSFWFAMALPLMFVYVSAAWMMLWWLVDMILIWTKTDQIVLRTVDFLGIFVVLAAVAAVIGYPIGVFLRRSWIPGRTHWFVSSVTVLVACAAGEWLYVATLVYRQTGLIDLPLAAELLVPILRTHHPSWIASKIIVAIAIGVGCYCAAKVRPTATVKL
jgi:hypothetical protein